MTFTDSIKTCIFTKFKDFNGRASRSEFWFFNLFYLLIYIFLGLGTVFISEYFIFIQLIYIIVFLIPMIAVSVRRLHDIDKSGWLYLLIAIPILNFLLLYFFCKKGTEGENRFGSPAI